MNEGQKITKGFTLPEVLIVVGILAILAFIAIVAIDPVARFRDARDSRRLTDIQSMTGAVHQYIIDHKGELPPGIDAREKHIGTNTTGCTLKTNLCNIELGEDCIDLTTVIGPYMHEVPMDPETGSAALTHYSVRLGNDNEIIIRSCDLTEKTP